MKKSYLLVLYRVKSPLFFLYQPWLTAKIKGISQIKKLITAYSSKQKVFKTAYSGKQNW